MRLLSWNVNGLRAVSQKGLFPWLEREKPDALCLQEIKVLKEVLDEDHPELLNPLGYHSTWFPAKKPGYSGVAVYSRVEPLSVQYGMGVEEFDNEGRVLTLEFKGFMLVNAYFPNSQPEGKRLDYKIRFCEKMLEHCKGLVAQGKHVVLCGDYNVAHQEIDLRHPKANVKNAGFLPEERAWMTKFLSNGFVDIFRERVPDPHHYTWWTYRAGAREKNVGWRIDYHCINPELRDRVKEVRHWPQVMGSDHCPVELWLK